MRVPDFFIVGAPKCGTTALYTYLKEHHSVFMPERKEVHYFCHDLNFPPRSAIRNYSEYLELFATAPDDVLIGEASASYLYSEVAIPEILRANPAAKFLVILRNPVDMAYSFHSQLLTNLTEDIVDFPSAWEAQVRRRMAENCPEYCVEPKFLQYSSVCSFSPQISRLIHHATRDRVFICIFEDFVRQPRQVYESILQFLSLAVDERLSFPKVNTNKRYRSMLLNRLLRRPPGPLDKVYLPLKRCANAIGLRPRGVLERINSRREPRPALDRQYRARLEAEFAPDVKRLEELLGRSLDIWRQPAQPQLSPDRVAPG